MPPHEKEKRFGGEGEKHGFNGIVGDDLSVVHQFGSAGFDAGKRVAGDECQLERAALGRRTGADADFILHDYFPVSYTHLDVYKRQSASCSAASARARG